MLFTMLLKTIVKRVHGVSHLFSFFNETYYPEDVHAIITVLKEAGLKSTATLAKLTVDGKVSEGIRANEALQQHNFNSIFRDRYDALHDHVHHHLRHPAHHAEERHEDQVDEGIPGCVT